MSLHRRLGCKPRPATHASVLATAILGLSLMPSFAHAATTYVQGESLVLNRSAGTVLTEKVASGRKTLKFWSNAAATRSIVKSDPTSRLTLRARGQMCGDKAPKLAVSVDGLLRTTISVTGTRYADYSSGTSIGSGTHTLEVAYINDFEGRTCDRNVYFDVVSFASTTTSAPTSEPVSTPAPTPAPTVDPVPAPAPAPAPAPSPTAPDGSVIFNGDFETNSLDQWTAVQRVASDRFSVSDANVRQGAHSARAEIRGGDSLLYTGQRSEVLWGGDNRLTLNTGDDYWFGWSTSFAQDFPSPTNGGHCLFVQWKNGGTGSPPLDLECKDERIQITYGGKCGNWSTPLVRGGWNDFVVHVKFSSDPSVGLVELWHKSPNDATLVKKVTDCRTATLNQGIGSYLKLGYYRRSDEPRTGVLHHDGMKVGTSFGAVAPS